MQMKIISENKNRNVLWIEIKSKEYEGQWNEKINWKYEKIIK